MKKAWGILLAVTLFAITGGLSPAVAQTLTPAPIKSTAKTTMVNSNVEAKIRALDAEWQKAVTAGTWVKLSRFTRKTP
jgi:hypothetical protein